MTDAPLYIAFHTPDALYSGEAARLRRSLDRLGLAYEIERVPDRGGWAQNAGQTAAFLWRMLDRHPGRRLVYLNADAVVWRRPALFDGPMDCDLAAHWVHNRQMANGTLVLNPTEKTRAVIGLYRRLCGQHPDWPDEQAFLQRAVNRLRPRMLRLPAALCWIHDINAEPGTEPVIEHLQASRAARHSPTLDNRLRRVAQVERLLPA